MRSILVSLCLSLAVPGCALFTGQSQGQSPGSMAWGNNSAAYEAQLEQYRAQVHAQPGAYQPATLFAAMVKGLVGAPATAPDLDREALVKEATGYLDAVDEEDYVYAALADKGSLLVAAKQGGEALKAFEASLENQPNVMAVPEMLPLLAAAGAADEIPTVCAGVREGIEAGDRTNILMYHCGSAGDPMAWASEEDKAAYAQFEAEQAQRAAEREAERQAEQERMAASFSQPDPAPSGGGSSSSSSPPPAGGGSISLRNDCKQKVRVFRGRVNGRYPGGGTFGWHSPNSVSSYSLSGSDQLCIVTENDREIVSCAGSGGSLRITDSCTGFAPR